MHLEVEYGAAKDALERGDEKRPTDSSKRCGNQQPAKVRKQPVSDAKVDVLFDSFREERALERVRRTGNEDQEY